MAVRFCLELSDLMGNLSSYGQILYQAFGWFRRTPLKGFLQLAA